MYNDKNWFHKDKQLSIGLHNRYCLFYFLRELLCGNQKSRDAIHITSPVASLSDVEKESMKKHFLNLIENTIGITPKIEID